MTEKYHQESIKRQFYLVIFYLFCLRPLMGKEYYCVVISNDAPELFCWKTWSSLGWLKLRSMKMFHEIAVATHRLTQNWLGPSWTEAHPKYHHELLLAIV